MAYSLSPTSINLMSDCPRCFWLTHKRNFKRPEGIFPSLPSGMDRILKEHFDSYLGKDELPPELVIHKITARLFPDRQQLDKWRSNRQGITWRDEKGNRLRGAVDNILINGEKLIVLDYKTRGYEVRGDTHEYYRDQMNFYNFLLRKNGHQTEDYSYLLFYHPNKVMESVFLFHTHLIKLDVDVNSVEKVWEQAIRLLDGPMPRPSGKCEYCKYREAKINASLLDY